jgi:hypothetical protein
MSDRQIALTEEERSWLAGLLKQVLKEQRVEEHRTRTPLYRQAVLQEEALVVSVLKKLGESPG